MSRSQKVGVVFFAFLFMVLLGFQCYGYMLKGQAFDLESLASGLFCVVFCYFYRAHNKR